MTTTSHVNSFTAVALPSRGVTLLAAVREVYRERRAARAEFNRVERELSTYTSPSDLAELDAMVERSDVGSETAYNEMIERIRLRAA